MDKKVTRQVAKRVYNGVLIDHYVTETTGYIRLAHVADGELTCTNPHCLAKIPPDTLFTVHTQRYFNGYVWKSKHNQPYCRTCVPFYEDKEE